MSSSRTMVLAALALAACTPSPTTPPDDACRTRLEKAVCLLGLSGTAPRSCLPGAGPYAAAFRSVYDELPRAYQRQLCTLARINVDPTLPSIAATEPAFDDDEQHSGYQISFQQRFLDARPSLSQDLTRQAQRPFTADPALAGTLPDLPRVTATFAPDSPFEALLVVLLHELSHVFDLQAGLNPLTCGDRTDDGSCFPATSWAALSWKTVREPRPESDFEGRADLCYFACDRVPLPPTRAEPLYGAWAGSDFATLYGTVNAREDLAEAFVLRLFIERGGRYQVTLPSGQVVDLLSRFASPRFAAKRRFADDVFARQAD